MRYSVVLFVYYAQTLGNEVVALQHFGFAAGHNQVCEAARGNHGGALTPAAA